MRELLRFKHIPLSAGYSAEIDTGVITQQLDGGAPRFRRISKNNINTVTCSFKFDEVGYQYIMSFYRVWMRNPSRPFFVEMFLDDPECRDYECMFVPNSLKLNSKNGLIYNVSVQFFVKSSNVSSLYDDLIIIASDEGIVLSELSNALEKLVNEDLPNALGEI